MDVESYNVTLMRSKVGLVPVQPVNTVNPKVHYSSTEHSRNAHLMPKKRCICGLIWILVAKREEASNQAEQYDAHCPDVSALQQDIARNHQQQYDSLKAHEASFRGWLSELWCIRFKGLGHDSRLLCNLEHPISSDDVLLMKLAAFASLNQYQLIVLQKAILAAEFGEVTPV